MSETALQNGPFDAAKRCISECKTRRFALSNGAGGMKEAVL